MLLSLLLCAGPVVVLGLVARPIARSSAPRAAVLLRASGEEDALRALPPAAVRDIAAEASVAASRLRPSSVPLFRKEGTEPDAERRLAILTYDDNLQHSQLVGEIISNVTTGARAGLTWSRPLALRLCTNATTARAAWAYDPCLGWSETSSFDNEIYLFSKLAPAAFLPTELLQPVPPELALVVRSMSSAHAEAASTEDLLAGTMNALDHATLYDFMRLVSTLTDGGGSSASSYDPLA